MDNNLFSVMKFLTDLCFTPNCVEKYPPLVKDNPSNFIENIPSLCAH